MVFVSLLAAALVGMMLGALWYSPVLFANQWMDSLGKTRETLPSPTRPMIGSIVASVMSAVGVFLVLTLVGADTLVQALYVGLILGVLIVFPALFSDNLFCGWGNKLLLIQSGYRVLTLVLMALVIQLVGG